MYHGRNVHLLLRVSIASVFLYAAIASIITPYNWVGYFPEFLRMVIPQYILLFLFSAYEILLSAWLLSGWKTMYAALFSACTLLGIIGANVTQLDILFRDFAIFFTAIALAIGSYKPKKT